MREIKFRGKAAAGFWVAGSLFVNERGEAYIYYPDGSRYPVSPETVGEFTGRKDKNGKEIYEGDIVKHNQGIDRVHWVDDQWRVGDWQPDGLAGFDCEVIGNIYDNPELLK